MSSQNGMLDLILQRIEQDPRIANNPNAKEMINVIKAGDSSRGEEMANNLLKSYGVSREEGLSQAQAFFGQMFGGGPQRR